MMDVNRLAELLTEVDSDLEKISDPLEPLKVASALRSEILKYEYRKKNAPKEISPLDYTIMAALMRQTPSRAEECKGIYPDGQYKCPACGASVTEVRDRQVGAWGTMTDVIKLNRCINCGQLIFWEDE